MAALTRTLFLAVFALFIASSLANDVPIRFCIKGLCNKGRSNVTVRLEGCVDKPATCTTGADGCCVMDKWETAPHYCFGSANNKCSWSIPADTDHLYTPSSRAEPGSRQAPREVTPRQYSCCQCNGRDTCRRIIWQDAASKQCPTSDTECFWNNFQTYGSGVEDYYTVAFTRDKCPGPKEGGRKLAQSEPESIPDDLGVEATIDVELKDLITDAVATDDNTVGNRR